MDKAPRFTAPRTRPEVANYNYWQARLEFAQQALTVAVQRRSLSHQHNPDQMQLREEHNGTA